MSYGLFCDLKDVVQIGIDHSELHCETVYFSNYFDYFAVEHKCIVFKDDCVKPALTNFNVYLQYLDTLFRALVKPTKVVGGLVPKIASLEACYNCALCMKVATMLQLAELVKELEGELIIVATSYEVQRYRLYSDKEAAAIKPNVCAALIRSKVPITVKVCVPLSPVLPLYTLVTCAADTPFLKDTFNFSELLQAFYKIAEHEYGRIVDSIDINSLRPLHAAYKSAVYNKQLVERALKMAIMRNVVEPINGSAENIRNATFRLTKFLYKPLDVIEYELQFLQQSKD